jgi:hypothetical protein
MKVYGGSWCIDPCFLDLSTSWRWWWASCPCCFTPKERAPGTHWIGAWLVPIAGLDNIEKLKFLTLLGLEPQPLSCPARRLFIYHLRYCESWLFMLCHTGLVYTISYKYNSGILIFWKIVEFWDWIGNGWNCSYICVKICMHLMHQQNP